MHGTPGNDTFSVATDVTQATLTLMSTNQRGVSLDLGAGDDTATGSAYGDDFTMGAGTNYVDGGTNFGTNPGGGGKAQDMLQIYVANQADANAVVVTALDVNSSGTDATAFASGYTAKVVAGSETDYVKGIESINIQIWNDKNGDGLRNGAPSSDPTNELTFARNISMVVNVNEVQLLDATHVIGGGLLANQMHFAWANGTSGNDSFSVTGDVSQATRDLMIANGRGVSVDLGAGNDTASGSAYGDDFTMGAGTNYVDGGTNLGTNSGGGNGQDMLQIYVTTQSEANAVVVTTLDASSSGADAVAWAGGYTNKVVAGVETDYVKGIEQINIQIWHDVNQNGQRDYYPDPTLNEVTLASVVTLIGVV